MSEANIKWSPKEYKAAAVVAQTAGEEMIARLDWMMIEPQVIVDAGCGVGDLSARLQARYPQAVVIAVDSSETMLQFAQAVHAAQPETARIVHLAANAMTLPLPDQSVDLITANFLLPWQMDWAQQLREWRRLLRPDGLLMLSMLGPDTMREWHAVIAREHRPLLMDMHDLGDLLLQEQFADPVLDVEQVCLGYKNLPALIQELQASGMLLAGAPTEAMQHTLSSENNWYVTYEVAHAHAFAPTQQEIKPSADGVVRVPLSHLRRQLRSG